ncbi:alkyl/aryl-sulfatase [Bacteroides sp.]
MKTNKKMIFSALFFIGTAIGGYAQPEASQYTKEKNREAASCLNFNNRDDFSDAQRGFIATYDKPEIKNSDESTACSFSQWDFLDQEAPTSAHPGLWRQSQLNHYHGLFEVIPDKIYQIRGFDIANMTFVKTDRGWVIIDVLTAEASAAAGYELVKKYIGDYPVKAVILTHSHADHFGGIEGIRKKAPNTNFEIIAPKGFYEEAHNENVIAGVAMGRRANYMFGVLLPTNATGNIGNGLGQNLSYGSKSIIRPTDEITRTGEKRSIDGLDMEFIFVPDAEAPVEIMIYFPQYKAFCTAEEITHNMHNLLTPRGAKVRNGLLWSKYIDQAIMLYGDKTEVSFASHHWPTWGNKKIKQYWEAQRDMYRYMHDQTLHLANRGLTPNEIAEELTFPESIDTLFHCRGYYGTLIHNVKSQYQLYFGWFDGNPANLNPLPPVELGRKYVEAMGGAEKVIIIAQEAYNNGEYRWCATLLNNLVFAAPDNQEARKLLADTYTQLGYQAESGPWRNFYLTGATELLKEKKEQQSAKVVDIKSISALSTDMLFDFLAIQISGKLAGGKQATVNINFTDSKENVHLILNNGALTHRMGMTDNQSPLSIELSKSDFIRLITRQAKPEELVQSGSLKIKGDIKQLGTIFAAMESSIPQFNIIEP